MDVQDKLNKENIETLDDLVKKLKTINDSYVLKKIDEKKEEKDNTEFKKKKLIEPEEKLCPICKALAIETTSIQQKYANAIEKFYQFD